VFTKTAIFMISKVLESEPRGYNVFYKIANVVPTVRDVG